MLFRSLGTANTYDGGTTVNAGTIYANSATSFGTGTITLGNTSGSSNASIYANTGSSLTIANSIVVATGNTATLTVGNTTAVTASYTTTFSGGVTGTNNLTLTNNGAGALVFGTSALNNIGTITNTGAGAGSTTISAVVGSNVTGITQNATSTLVLSNTSNAFGSTTITSGTLKLGAAGVIPDSSAVSVTGTLDLNSYSETVGSIAEIGRAHV